MKEWVLIFVMFGDNVGHTNSRGIQLSVSPSYHQTQKDCDVRGRNTERLIKKKLSQPIYTYEGKPLWGDPKTYSVYAPKVRISYTCEAIQWMR